MLVDLSPVLVGGFVFELWYGLVWRLFWVCFVYALCIAGLEWLM